MKLSLLQKFQAYIAEEQLFNHKDTLFLACSGGLDSVVLAHLLQLAGYHFTFLHCNFQMRGEESNRDELFVKSLATQLHLPFLVQTFDTQKEMKQMKKGVQETARILRYNWFNEVVDLAEGKRKWLLTAHHADDQVETILMHLFRGTGLGGIQGMKVKTGHLVRPLLFTDRVTLLNYAIEHNLKWVEDSSNETDDYNRNFIRHKIVPLVEEIFPSVKTTLLQTGKRFKEIDLIYQQRINALKNKLVEQRESGWAIAVNKLSSMQPLDTIMHELFSPYGFSTQQITELKKLFEASSGKYVASDQYRVLRNRGWLLIEPIGSKVQAIKVVEDANSLVVVEPFSLVFKQVAVDHPISHDANQALLNLKKITFPLLVRKWKPGDYFYPLGMKKKKKIARFLTDLKLSLTEKENQWVVESDKKIVWVVGRRMDDRFKIDEKTASKLLITISPLSE